MSRNIKKDAAVKYPRHRDVSALAGFVSNIVEENYLKVVGKNYNLSPLERQMDEITVGFPNVYAKNLRTLSEDNIMTRKKNMVKRNVSKCTKNGYYMGHRT